MMRELELLAPAKNADIGIGAIDHGADAVYIGPPHFGARAAAGNSIADIARLCDYAHQFSAKVYATVNTLLRDDELPQAEQLIGELADAHVDAILIQDMRLLSLNPQQKSLNPQQKSLNTKHSTLNSKLSPLNFHASTQADNRTAQQLQWLLDHGIRRAVLARELSIDQIAHLHRAVPGIELEAFVHGALCVSYSGLCNASEHCFGRSANRGECAQFCRMKFDLLDAQGHELIHQRHLLSLRDLNLSQHLAQLIEAGVVSFKIEGRLKDMAYVKNVTAAYSQLLNQYIAAHADRYERASRGRCRYTFRPDLNRTFNRGYTTYFALGRQPRQAQFDTPKAIGQPVGHVKELRGSTSFTVAGTAAFANGDGLCFFDAQRQLVGFRVNRAEGGRLFPQRMPDGLRPGTVLYRSSDQAMERELSRPSAERKIPIQMQLSVTPDGFALRSGSTEVSMPIEHQQAKTPQHQHIVQNLSKLGNTPYECTDVAIPDHFPYFIPASTLAALRRLLIDKLRDVAVGGTSPLSFGRGVGGDAFPFGRGAEGDALMQCRYCLRHELGFCVRHGGQRPTWHEPLSLRLADGRCFPLEFDCRQCQMNVKSER